MLSAVETLGYVHNRVAGTLASAGSNLVGVIVPSLANVVFPEVLRGIGLALETSGHQPVIGVTNYDPLREEALIASLLSWRPAGMIVAGLEHTPRATAMLRGSAGRVAEILDTDGRGIDIVVGFSNDLAGKASAEHLVARGYRRIGFVGHDVVRDVRAGKRLRGFEAALAARGQAVLAMERGNGPSSVGAGRAGLERLLARRPDLDAIYFSNDDMAIGGYFHCLARGISVPDELAIMGYNGLDVGQLAPQPLTTLRTPRMRVGELGARLICSDEPAGTTDLGFELMPGATA